MSRLPTIDPMDEFILSLGETKTVDPMDEFINSLEASEEPVKKTDPYANLSTLEKIESGFAASSSRMIAGLNRAGASIASVGLFGPGSSAVEDWFTEKAKLYEKTSEISSEMSQGIVGRGSQIFAGLGLLAPTIGAAAVGAPATVPLAGAAGISFVAGYGNKMLDMEKFEVENEIELPAARKQAIAIGAGAIDFALTYVPGGKLSGQIAGKSAEKIGQAILTKNFKTASTEIAKVLAIDATEVAAVMGTGQAVHNLVTKYGYDENQSVTEGVPESAALGFFLTLGTGGVAAGIKTRQPIAQLKNHKQALVKAGVLKPEEAAILGTDVKAITNVVRERAKGNEVSIKTKPDGSLDITSTIDVVPAEVKKALDYNDALINVVRTRMQSGKSAGIIVEPEIGPVKPKELQDVLASVDNLSQSLTIKPMEISKDGVPLTRRAVLKGDLDFIKAELETKYSLPEGRQLLEQARGLVETVSRGGRAKTIDPAPMDPRLVGPRKEILTPYKVRPKNRVRVIPDQAKIGKYLDRPETLTDNLRIRDAIAKQQKLFAEKFAVLADGTRLTGPEAFVAGRITEQKLIDRVDALLKRDDNSINGAKKQILREAKAKIKPDEAPGVITQLEKAIGELTKKTAKLTQRETIVRLLEVAQNPKTKTKFSLQSIKLLKDIKSRIISDPKSRPWSQRAQDKLREIESLVPLLTERAKLGEQTRARVREMAQDLPDDMRARLLDKVIRAKSAGELGAVVKQVGEAIRKDQLDVAKESIVGNVKLLKSNLEREAGKDLVKKYLGEQKKVETVRLYRGNRKTGDEGNISYTTSLEGIARPFAKAYGGDITYIDIPKADLDKYRAGPGSTKDEYIVTPELAKTAKKLDEAKNSATSSNPGNVPVFSISPETGQESILIPGLKSQLSKMDLDQLKLLDKELTAVVRRGQIERGLYNDVDGFINQETIERATKELSTYNGKGELSQKLDTVKSVGQQVVDPVSIEGWLYLLAQGNENAEIYKQVVGRHIEAYSRAEGHSAEARKFLARKTKEILGFDPDSSLQNYKLLKYLEERLPNGIERQEAMWAYAMLGDAGRAEAIKRDGIRARRKSFDLDESIKLLSDRDKKFVDETKKYLSNNYFIEKAMDEYSLVTGSEIERSPSGFFTSRRDRTLAPSELEKESSHIAFARVTDALKARTEFAGTPFDLTGGYLSAYHSYIDSVARYAEMNRGLLQAERLLLSPKFQNSFINKFGQARHEEMLRYLKNIHGFLGRDLSALDSFISNMTALRAAGRVTGSIKSFARQHLSFLTQLGDNVLDAKALAKAVTEGSYFNSRIGKTMRDESGMAYMRLSAGKFLENQLVLGQRKLSPKLSFLQEKSFFLQHFADDHMLRVYWRAAEIMAKEKGLTGREARNFIRSKFELALQRGQSSASPLFTTNLELEAKSRPGLRAVISLRRELNRTYNIVRRHVGRAIQQPTAENVAQAAKALMFAGVSNTLADVAITSSWLVATGLPAYDSTKFLSKSLSNLTGNFYLIGDLYNMFTFGDVTGTLSPAAVVVEGLQAAEHMYNFYSTEPDEKGNPQMIRSGINRGRDKTDVELEKALDKFFSASSLGVPFWAIWTQSKQMYNWKREDFRLMVQFEQTRAKLNLDPELNKNEIKRLDKTSQKISEIHERRRTGRISSEDASSQVVDLLKLALE